MKSPVTVWASGVSGSAGIGSWAARSRRRTSASPATDSSSRVARHSESSCPVIALRPVIAEAQERGVITFEQLSGALEEVEVTKEQVAELHGFFLEHGIEVVGNDGRLATSEAGKVEVQAEARRAEKAEYLREKLEKRAQAERDADS